MLVGKSGGQLLILIAPVRMKQQGQSRSDVQVWMCRVVKVKSHVVKKNIALEASVLGPWIKVNWIGQAEDGKIEHQHLRNQWTKMNENGRI